MNPDTIRNWLMAKPKPAGVRLTVNGEERDITIGTQTWAKVAQTVCALQPTLIEALDPAGSVLRATQGETDELAPEAAPKAVAAATLVDVGTLQLMAKLLADAYKHSTETAFERLADLFDTVNKRSESLERSLALSERMRIKQAEEIVAGEESEGGGLGQLLRAFTEGQASAPATKTTNGKHS